MRLNAKHQATLAAIYARPTRLNIPFSAVEALLKALGGQVDEGAGSRIAIALKGQRLHLHRPHPGKEAKRYQIDDTREFLERIGVKP